MFYKCIIMYKTICMSYLNIIIGLHKSLGSLQIPNCKTVVGVRRKERFSLQKQLEAEGRENVVCRLHSIKVEDISYCLDISLAEALSLLIRSG